MNSEGATPRTSRNQTVLIVDDDPLVPTLIRMTIERNLPDVRVLTARNGLQGLETLRNHRVDLLITDLHMPEMDGITFLSHVMEEFPHIPRVVLTSLGGDVQDYARKAEVIAVLSKPIDTNRFPEQVREWLERYIPHTQVERLRLSSFAQLVSLDRKTCALGVRDLHSGRIGMLYFREGTLVDATAGEMEGDDAALLLLAWPEVQVWVHDYVPESLPKRVQSPLQWLLLEAARLSDEGNAEARAQREAKVPTPQQLRQNRPDAVVAQPAERPKLSPLPRAVASPRASSATLPPRPAPVRPPSAPPNPLSLGKLIDRAIEAFRAGNYIEAKQLWEQAREIEPENGMIRHNLAVIEKCLAKMHGSEG